MEQNNKMVSWEMQDDIGILSISNGKENYIETPDFIDINKLKEWVYNSNAKGIIIRGVGRNFSAGADIEKLKELTKDSVVLADKMDRGKEILNFIEDLNVPVISAINGVCFGGGLEIALASHIRIASNRALFAFPETNHGLIPGLGGTYRLTQLVGKKVYEIILNADMINAEKAKQLGIINYISESKDAFELAKEKMESMISDRPLELIQSAMKSIRNSNIMSRKEALKEETELFCKLAVNVNFHQQD